MDSVENVTIDEALVKKLVSTQFAGFSKLEITTVASDGTDNALFRLGKDMVVRLPRHESAVGQIGKEQEHLPRLAPHLSLVIPEPLKRGQLSAAFPFPWSICRWIEGTSINEANVPAQLDLVSVATKLANFVHSLQAVEIKDGPAPGHHNFWRGVPLQARDQVSRRCIAELEAIGGLIDAPMITEAWEQALAAQVWDRAPLWIHGDLHGGNLLHDETGLCAVIDWGGLGVGDPAVELIPAWSLFDDTSREAYRGALGYDEATWQRGKGWALSMAIMAWPFYIETNPAIVKMSERIIRRVVPGSLLK